MLRYEKKDVDVCAWGRKRGLNKVRPLLTRFCEKVSPEPNSGCWLWAGALTTGGYGYIQKGGRSGAITASRLAYTLFKGEVPDDMIVCHRCDVRCCVNPDHLFLGTNAVNYQDMINKGRLRSPDCIPVKLTPQQVADIRTRRMRQVDFAKMYGVSESLVSRILSGQCRVR